MVIMHMDNPLKKKSYPPISQKATQEMWFVSPLWTGPIEEHTFENGSLNSTEGKYFIDENVGAE